MSMRALVSAHWKFGHMTLQRVVGELNLGGAILSAARRRIEERQRSGIRNQTALVAVASFAFGSYSRRASAFTNLMRTAFKEIFLLVVSVRKNKIVIEDETRIVKKVHHNGQISDCNEARCTLTAIDMLAPRI